MKVLVVGSGGREHALALKLSQSPQVDQVYTATGNAGTAQLGENISTGVDVLDEIQSFVVQHDIDWTVVGPEATLAEGIVDVFNRLGLKIYGPTRKAARLESSKAFAKAFMQRHSIPTAAYAEFSDAAKAEAYIRECGHEVVVKADGLAAGKGVVVPESADEAIRAARAMLEEGQFGHSGRKIVIEQKLSGEEATLMCFVDGKTILPMLPAQDHKRAYDNDEGPNTGGMGVYAPTPLITPALMETITQRVLNPTIQGLQQDGIDYRGVLYVGLMIVDGEPFVIEYNARFGDPETQVVLPLLKTDLMDVIKATHDQTLAQLQLSWSEQSACGVVMAAGGYPVAYAKGKEITGLDQVEGATVYHAGTLLTEDGRTVSDGGRVLCVTALGDTLEAARSKAYAEIKKIHFEGVHYRTDIGARAEKY